MSLELERDNRDFYGGSAQCNGLVPRYRAYRHEPGLFHYRDRLPYAINHIHNLSNTWRSQPEDNPNLPHNEPKFYPIVY